MGHELSHIAASPKVMMEAYLGSIEPLFLVADFKAYSGLRASLLPSFYARRDVVAITRLIGYNT